jgi:hypothetical protein
MYEVELDRGLPWKVAQQLLEEHQQQLALQEAGLTSPGACVPAVLASKPAPAADGQAPGSDPVQLEEEGQQQPQQQPEAVKLEGGTAAGDEQAVEGEEQQQQQPVPASAGKRQRQEDGDTAAAGGSTGAAAAEEGGGPAKRSKLSPAATAQKKQKQQQQQMKSEEGDTIDLTRSDSEGDAAKPGGSGSTPAAAVKPSGAKPRRWESGFYRAKQEGINRQVGGCSKGERGMHPSKGCTLDGTLGCWDDLLPCPADATSPCACCLVCLLARLQVHVLLALQVAGSQPPTFTIHRPATGRGRQIMSLQVGRGPDSAHLSPCTFAAA